MDSSAASLLSLFEVSVTARNGTTHSGQVIPPQLRHSRCSKAHVPDSRLHQVDNTHHGTMQLTILPVSVTSVIIIAESDKGQQVGRVYCGAWFEATDHQGRRRAWSQCVPCQEAGKMDAGIQLLFTLLHFIQ